MRCWSRRRRAIVAILAVVAIATAVACADDDIPPSVSGAPPELAPDVTEAGAEASDMSNRNADVLRVDVEGEPGGYTFAVTVASADTGCDAYADWWEVLSADGALLYRRTLAHSHVNEQPFLRSGGPVAVEAEHEIIVRAHTSTTGYGGIVLRGSVADGFESDRVSADFAADVEHADPQPPPCAF